MTQTLALLFHARIWHNVEQIAKQQPHKLTRARKFHFLTPTSVSVSWQFTDLVYVAPNAIVLIPTNRDMG